LDTAGAGKKDSPSPDSRHILASLGRQEELAMHIRATKNTGVTSDEVKEVFLQVAVYAGAPAANSAFAIAKRTYKKMESEPK